MGYYNMVKMLHVTFEVTYEVAYLARSRLQGHPEDMLL
jgi:hypothetical protein